MAMVIAGLAVSFAAFGVAFTVIGIAFLQPVIVARPGRRLAVVAWTLAIGPPALLVSAHYLAWGMICYYEGGRPQFITDPHIENVHNTPIMRSTLIAIQVATAGIAVSFFGSIPMVWMRVLRSSKDDPIWLNGFGPLLALPLVWIVGYLLLV